MTKSRLPWQCPGIIWRHQEMQTLRLLVFCFSSNQSYCQTVCLISIVSVWLLFPPLFCLSPLYKFAISQYNILYITLHHLREDKLSKFILKYFSLTFGSFLQLLQSFSVHVGMENKWRLADYTDYSLTNTGLVSPQPVFNLSRPQSLQGDLSQGLVSTLFTTTLEDFLSQLCWKLCSFLRMSLYRVSLQL